MQQPPSYPNSYKKANNSNTEVFRSIFEKYEISEENIENLEVLTGENIN
jgi:hypothetical protein